MKTNNILIFLLIFISCNKAHERSCWKSNGEMSTYTIEHPPLINKLKISDDIDVILINDSLSCFTFLELFSRISLDASLLDIV